MRYVAVTAAVLGSAFFLAPSSPVSLTDASNFNNVIKTPAVQTVEPRIASANVMQAAAPVEKAAEVKKVVVEPGDHLTKIAAENETTYRRVYDANPSVNDPDLIYPGQELRIPPAEEVLTPRPVPENAPPAVKTEAAAPAATAKPYAAPAVPRAKASAPAAAVAGGSVWDKLAACESGGNWAINTGNGYYGGLQFTLSTWQSVGGSGYPHQASREEQIARGQILQARSGWGQWPACTAKLGLR